jgi:hypothetical protein
MLKMLVFPIDRDCLICGKVLLGKGQPLTLPCALAVAWCPSAGGLFLLHPHPSFL